MSKERERLLAAEQATDEQIARLMKASPSIVPLIAESVAANAEYLMSMARNWMTNGDEHHGQMLAECVLAAQWWLARTPNSTWKDTAVTGVGGESGEVPDELREKAERAVFDAWAVCAGSQPTADESWWHIHRSGPTHTKWAADAALAAVWSDLQALVSRDEVEREVRAKVAGEIRADLQRLRDAKSRNAEGPYRNGMSRAANIAEGAL